AAAGAVSPHNGTNHQLNALARPIHPQTTPVLFSNNSPYRPKEGVIEIARVSVQKYRSIDRAADFGISDYTVLIGPNNQGKSNLLRAAVLAMEIIEGWGELREDKVGGTEVPISQILKDSRRPYYRTRARGGERRVGYNWESDFPIFARGRRGSQQATAIRLDFELSEIG